MNDVPQRVRVTGPRRGTPQPLPRLQGQREIDANTRVGEIYVASLMREQLRLGTRAVGALIAVLVVLTGSFWLWPDLGTMKIVGLPIAWVVIGGGLYPLLIVMAWRYVRRAERNERDFAAMVTESDSS